MDNNSAEQQLLRDPDIYPSNKVLASALGQSYSAYDAFIEKLPDFGIEPEWRYYNDGKSWLCKCVRGKKTVFWLSVWEGFFKVSLFFTEKTRGGIGELTADDSIKTAIANASAIGKLFPLILDVRSESFLDEAYKLIEYKRKLK